MNPDGEGKDAASTPEAFTRQEFERFRQMALADERLHELLLAARHPDDFAILAVALGRERGCQFDGAAVLEAIQEARRAWLERWV